MRCPIAANALIRGGIRLADGRLLPVQDVIVDTSGQTALGLEVRSSAGPMFVPWLALTITDDCVTARAAALQPAALLDYYVERGARMRRGTADLGRLVIDSQGKINHAELAGVALTESDDSA